MFCFNVMYMNFKGLVYWGAFLVLMSICLILYIQYDRQKKEVGQTTSVLKHTQGLVEKMLNEQIALVGSEGFLLNKELSIVSSNNSGKSLIDVVGKRRVLVLYFSLNNCSDCYNYCLDELKSHSLEKALVFVSGFNVRDLYVFSRSNHFNNEMFCVKGLGLPTEQLNMPFMFVVGSDLKPTHFFIPKKEHPIQTDKYLELVNDYLSGKCG